MKYPRIFSAMQNELWAITPEKLDEIVDFMSVKITDEQIAARISMSHSQPAPVAKKDGVAILNLSGTLIPRATWMSEFSGGTSMEIFGQQIDAALTDESVKKILVLADTPGGSVTLIEETARKMFVGKNIKPIYTIASGGMLASGGYWLASASTEIYSTPSATHIGSLGVIQVVSWNPKENTKVFRTSPNKAALNGIEAPTEAAEKDLMVKLNAIHNVFYETVAEFRGVPRKTVDEKFGQGKTFTAREALALGMIDRIISVDDLFSEWSVERSASVSVNVLPLKSERVSEMKLTPKIRLALVKSQLVTASALAADFEAALKLVADVSGLAADASEADIIKAIGDTSAEKPAAPVVPAAVPVSSVLTTTISIAEVSAMVRLAANVPDAKKFELVSEISDAIEAGEITTMKAVRDRISAVKAAESTPVGPAAHVNVAESDKIIDQCVARIMAHEYVGRDISTISIQSANGVRPLTAADVSNDNRLNGPIGMARVILSRNPAVGNRVYQLSNEDVARIACGAPLYDFGIGSYADGAAYNTSGLFRAVLANAIRTVARMEYAETPVMFERWTRRGKPINDFEKHTIKALGSLTDPRIVAENDEFEEQTMAGAEAEAVRLNIWGGIYSHSYQQMLLDDLGFFANVQKLLVRRLRRKQDTVCSLILVDNLTMGDNIALFHASHNNLYTAGGSGGANLFTKATVAAARKLLALQKPVGASENPDIVDDGDPLGFLPYAALVPTELSEDAIIYFTSQSQPAQANPNVRNPHVSLINKGGIMELPRLSADYRGGSALSWYLLADPADCEFVSYHYLGGNPQPRVETAESFSSLSFKTRVWLPFGASAKDFRGAVKIVQ